MHSGFQHTITAERVVTNGDNICFGRRNLGLWVAALQLPAQQVARIERRCHEPGGRVTWCPEKLAPGTYVVQKT